MRLLWWQKATESLQEALDRRQAEVEELQRESRSSSQARMEASQALAAAGKAEQEHQQRQAAAEAGAHAKYERQLAASQRHARHLEVCRPQNSSLVSSAPLGPMSVHACIFAAM